MKACIICAKTKVEEEFALRGLGSVCLECLNDERVVPAKRKNPVERFELEAMAQPIMEDFICPRCSHMFKSNSTLTQAKCTKCKLLFNINNDKTLEFGKKSHPDPLIIKMIDPPPGEWRKAPIINRNTTCPSCKNIYTTTREYYNVISECPACQCEFKTLAPEN